MSKRAEQAALKAYPKENGKVWSSAFGTFEFDRNAGERKGYQEGYEQAEKDIIERVIDWVRKNVYIYTDTQNDEEGNLMAVFLEKAFIDDLKNAMEEE